MTTTDERTKLRASTEDEFLTWPPDVYGANEYTDTEDLLRFAPTTRMVPMGVNTGGMRGIFYPKGFSQTGISLEEYGAVPICRRSYRTEPATTATDRDLVTDRDLIISALELLGWADTLLADLPEVATGGSQVALSKYPIEFTAANVVHGDVYEARIEELRGFAEDEEDDEDIEPVNEDSIGDFWSFMGAKGFSRRAGLVLLDNGNLRAVWRDNAGSNVGLEFLGGGTVLYVMFKPYVDGRETAREADIATFDTVVDKLRDLDLLSFVSE